MTDKPRGPASYFPTIEAKHGRTIDEWLPVLASTGLSSHKELVEYLKTEHGFGHGHAGALAHHFLHQGVQDDQIAGLFTAKKTHWRPVYDRISSAIDGLGDVQVLPKKGMVGFAKSGAKGQFVVVAPSTADRFDVGLKLPGVAPSGRLPDADGWYTSMTHRVQLTTPDQLDDELLARIAEAYAASA